MASVGATMTVPRGRSPDAATRRTSDRTRPNPSTAWWNQAFKRQLPQGFPRTAIGSARSIADTVDTRRTWSLTASIVTSPGRRTYRRPHHTAHNDAARSPQWRRASRQVVSTAAGQWTPEGFVWFPGISSITTCRSTALSLIGTVVCDTYSVKCLDGDLSFGGVIRNTTRNPIRTSEAW